MHHLSCGIAYSLYYPPPPPPPPDQATNELVLCVAEGAKNIRVPVGQGIAGSVAATGETINIVDAYADPRFSSAADKATGYRTTTILCMPIKALSGQIVGKCSSDVGHRLPCTHASLVAYTLTAPPPSPSPPLPLTGVLQAINKKDGTFSQTDEEVMDLLATQSGIAVQNANVFRSAEASRDKVRCA